jgi:hypothetical protein
MYESVLRKTDVPSRPALIRVCIGVVGVDGGKSNHGIRHCHKPVLSGEVEVSRVCRIVLGTSQ